MERLIEMIDKEQWSTLQADVKGDIYENLNGLGVRPCLAARYYMQSVEIRRISE